MILTRPQDLNSGDREAVSAVLQTSLTDQVSILLETHKAEAINLI
jgi:hypothetical protein